jgi:hypothetical protein
MPAERVLRTVLKYSLPGVGAASARVTFPFDRIIMAARPVLILTAFS